MKNENLPIESDKEFKNQTVQTKEEIENDDKKTTQTFLDHWHSIRMI